MAIDPKSVGRRVGPIVRGYDWRDCALYALAVGSGFEELSYCREVDQVVIPTFGITASFDFIKTAAEAAQANLDGVLHAGQSLEVLGPFPPEGTLSTEGEITALYDKGEGRGALLIADAITTHSIGRAVLRSRCTLLCRKDGGFGGDRGPSTAAHAPDRPPDIVESARPPENQPLLYRLLGDTHPLHSDPVFAKAAGFDRPIMHGLSTFGYACRAVIRHVLEGDPSELGAFGGRFVSPLYPGRPVRTEIWLEEGGATFRVVDDETDRTIVDAGEARRRQGGR